MDWGTDRAYGFIDANQEEAPPPEVSSEAAMAQVAAMAVAGDFNLPPLDLSMHHSVAASQVQWTEGQKQGRGGGLLGGMGLTQSAVGFNVRDGYLEARARGLWGRLLGTGDYNALTQCENMEDVRLFLGGTAYGPALAGEPSPLHTATIVARCSETLVSDWEHMRAQVRCPPVALPARSPPPPRSTRSSRRRAQLPSQLQ